VSTVLLISSAAKAKGIPFLLAGGHAVIAHGFPRSTFDLDLIIRGSDGPQWRRVLKEMDYTLHHEGPAFVQFNPPNAEMFPVDLMLVNENTFEKLWTDAVPSPAWPEVKVVSLMNLLALKCHSIKHGHPGRVVKDADDVIRLIQNNRLDPESRELRELFLKHGTEEFYEKVRRASAQG
jgi:hypothetical protein